MGYRPTIAVNALYLSRQRKTGIEVYADNIVRRIISLGSDIDWACLAPEPVDIVASNVRWIKGVRSASVFSLGFEIPSLARRVGADLFFNPSQYAPVIGSMPVVSVAFDVAWRFYPQYFPVRRRIAFEFLTRHMCRYADRILAISAATKADILTHYSCPESKVQTIPLGFDADLFVPDSNSDDRAVVAELGVRPPYLLYVGTLQRRKNLEQLVKAFELLNLPRFSLVLAGGNGWFSQQIRERISASPATSRIHVTGYVPTHTLPALYRCCEAFIYPSLYEGFGLPVLEAMACGAPVVTSNRSSLVEVAGSAAECVDPDDPKAIAQGIHTVLRDRDRYNRQSIRRAGAFSWDKSAHATLDALVSAFRLKHER